jgi:hypothetical protein
MSHRRLLSPPEGAGGFLLTGDDMAEGHKVVFAVIHLGKNGLETVCERGGRRRRVNVTWSRKELSDLPPENWAEQAAGEMDFQDSNRMPDIG